MNYFSPFKTLGLNCHKKFSFVMVRYLLPLTSTGCSQQSQVLPEVSKPRGSH